MVIKQIKDKLTAYLVTAFKRFVLFPISNTLHQYTGTVVQALLEFLDEDRHHRIVVCIVQVEETKKCSVTCIDMPFNIKHKQLHADDSTFVKEGKVLCKYDVIKPKDKDQSNCSRIGNSNKCFNKSSQAIVEEQYQRKPVEEMPMIIIILLVIRMTLSYSET